MRKTLTKNASFGLAFTVTITVAGLLTHCMHTDSRLLVTDTPR